MLRFGFSLDFSLLSKKDIYFIYLHESLVLIQNEKKAKAYKNVKHAK